MIEKKLCFRYRRLFCTTYTMAFNKIYSFLPCNSGEKNEGEVGHTKEKVSAPLCMKEKLVQRRRLDLLTLVFDIQTYFEL